MAHKNVILSAIFRILNLPPTEKIFLGKVQSASVSYFEIDKNFRVKDFNINEVSHLASASLKNKMAEPNVKVKLNKTNTEGINWIKSNYPVKNEQDIAGAIHFDLTF